MRELRITHTFAQKLLRQKPDQCYVVSHFPNVLTRTIRVGQKGPYYPKNGAAILRVRKLYQHKTDAGAYDVGMGTLSQVIPLLCWKEGIEVERGVSEHSSRTIPLQIITDTYCELPDQENPIHKTDLDTFAKRCGVESWAEFWEDISNTSLLRPPILGNSESRQYVISRANTQITASENGIRLNLFAITNFNPTPTYEQHNTY